MQCPVERGVVISSLFLGPHTGGRNRGIDPASLQSSLLGINILLCRTFILVFILFHGAKPVEEPRGATNRADS